MAQNDRGNPNVSSVDATLRALTDRPNVQSTLILSKRDGSIIRATGLIVSGKHSVPRAGQTSRWTSGPNVTQDSGAGEGGDHAADGQEQGEESQHQVTPAEVLASAIFQFAKNASTVGAVLGGISRQADKTSGGIYGDGSASMQEVGGEDESHKVREDEVQLLRLRTKNQEIIIFPDPNYICCVVQRMGKVGSATDGK
ncbi:hypothetical protein B0A52_06516 [Exophiala mesophila]|uniref:Roadblock/LAMTOR2 domain-containing protein n=1 Tax=Exophiala mesophila TaxID=212818 RepID=A0A438N1L5_EXOME|nr:hypothetical protein B0A52_06516 [Exophiala mesophila]